MVPLLAVLIEPDSGAPLRIFKTGRGTDFGGDRQCPVIRRGLGVNSRPPPMHDSPQSRPRRDEAARTSDELVVFYQARGDGGNILTNARLAFVAQVERDFDAFVTRTSGWPQDIPLPMSTVFSQISAAGGRSDLVAQAMEIGNLRLFVAGSVDLETRPVRAELLRSTMQIKNRLDSAMMERYVKELESYSDNDVGVEVVFHSTPLYNWQVGEYIKHDLVLGTAALGFVVVYLLLHTESVWLTVVGLLNIVLAFPLVH